MPSLPSSQGLNWVKIRALADQLARSEAGEGLAQAAESDLAAFEGTDRMLAIYLLGFTSGGHPERLELLRQRVPADPSWEVQEALAQAFDAYCTAVGYEAALPTIDAWLADPQPNARRAVSEGLRIWTSKGRAYFAEHPGEAIRRLAALRQDPSDYVRHSAGNALRDIRRAHAALVDAETATWNLNDPLEAFTYRRVLKAQ
jgi:3-methyladenine DNA glycosylase AlkC